MPADALGQGEPLHASTRRVRWRGHHVVVPVAERLAGGDGLPSPRRRVCFHPCVFGRALVRLLQQQRRVSRRQDELLSAQATSSERRVQHLGSIRTRLPRADPKVVGGGCGSCVIDAARKQVGRHRFLRRAWAQIDACGHDRARGIGSMPKCHLLAHTPRSIPPSKGSPFPFRPRNGSLSTPGGNRPGFPFTGSRQSEDDPRPIKDRKYRGPCGPWSDRERRRTTCHNQAKARARTRRIVAFRSDPRTSGRHEGLLQDQVGRTRRAVDGEMRWMQGNGTGRREETIG